MDVIGHAVDDESGASHLTNDSTQVREQIVTDFGGDEGPAILGAEDQVDDEIARSMRQVSFAPSELAASCCYFPTARAVGCILTPLRGYGKAYGAGALRESLAVKTLCREFHFGTGDSALSSVQSLFCQ